MATAATTAKGTILKVKVGAGTLTKVSELKDFDGLQDGAPSVLDATHLESSSKEKITGINDEGQLTFTFNYVVADTGQLLLETARSTSALANFELTFVGKKYTFDGFVLSTSKSGSVDKINDLVVKVEVSGSITVV